MLSKNNYFRLFHIIIRYDHTLDVLNFKKNKEEVVVVVVVEVVVVLAVVGW